LTASIHEPGKTDDRETRALCYLITQGARLTEEGDLNWRNDRLCFQAFKNTVRELLDRLAPPSAAEAWNEEENGPKEEWGRAIGRDVLLGFLENISAGLFAGYGSAPNSTAESGSVAYALIQAARDLGFTKREKDKS
jgi:hypothetical protein